MKRTGAITSDAIRLDEFAVRLRWVISIRWTVVVALVLVGVLGPSLRGDSSQTSVAHLALAGSVALYNLFYFWASGLATLNYSAKRFLKYSQIAVDLAVFTAIVGLSGGVTGPVFVLYFLYIFVGLAILPPVGAYVVAATAALCYTFLAVYEALTRTNVSSKAESEPVSFGPYLGYILTVSATLFIIAYIANYFAGLVTKNEGTIREQLNEINTLYSFTRSISSIFNIDEVARILVKSACEIERADAGSVILLNKQGEGTVAAVLGYADSDVDRLTAETLTPDHPLALRLMNERRGIYAPRPDEQPGLRSHISRPGTRSFYSIPLWDDERLIGSLNLNFDRPYTMPRNHWNLLSAMAQQSTLAMERTRLFADTQRAARESASLYQIGLVTISSLQIDEVLQLIYEQVNKLLHPDTFYIALFDEDLGELRYDIYVEDGKPLTQFRSRLDSAGISGWVVRNRKPIFIHNLEVEREQLPFEPGIMGPTRHSSISVPLIAKDKIVGVMSLQSEKAGAFDQNHLRLIVSIANQAALALENARLHATVNEQAQRDTLTGAYNHGTFVEKLNKAVSDATSSGESVALIMLDIDKFKQYNDTYGHLIGNDVLRTVVGSIQGHVKSTDVVGRWGGEEFAILLANVNRAQARLVAERVKQTTARYIMKDLNSRPIPSPTVSQGIALYPEDALQIEELIGKADSALYAAKDLGRNSIVEWISMFAGSPT